MKVLLKGFTKTKRETCTSDFNEFTDETKRGDFSERRKVYPGRVGEALRMHVWVLKPVFSAAACSAINNHFFPKKMKRKRENSRGKYLIFVHTYTQTALFFFLWFSRNMWTGIRTQKLLILSLRFRFVFQTLFSEQKIINPEKVFCNVLLKVQFTRLPKSKMFLFQELLY